MSRLWGITSYFNPAGFHHRLSNYRIFREYLDIPLATIELSFGDKFVLEDSDADILLQLQTEDVMWQKERLLNLIVQHLPKECDQVAWIDCDIVFDSRDWVTRAENALEHTQLLHLYDHRIELPESDSLPEVFSQGLSHHDYRQTPSAIYLDAIGEAGDDDFQHANSPVGKRSTVGLAWACSRDLLHKHGLYDACIIGGADRAILGAAMGRFDLGVKALKMSGVREKHYLSWASAFYESVQAQVSYIPGRVFHLWHGELKNRQYESRLDVINQHAFDPYQDILIDDLGLWKWSSSKPELHRDISAYFYSRREDG